MVSMSSDWKNLFPTPVWKKDSWRELTIDEEHFFTRMKSKEKQVNKGNSHTRENYVLNAPEMTNLKKDLTNAVNSYFQEVWQPIYDVKVYITISWINYTEVGQFHHEHIHANSIVSGVYYIDTDDSDKIFFNNPQPLWSTLRVEPREYNIWNCGSSWLPTPKNSLILFPSKLEHYVRESTNPNTRISLSFNTFLKGKLSDTLDELYL